MSKTRWATFDVYGTLVDWRSGMNRELARLIPGAQPDELLASYHEIEPKVQSKHPDWSYRRVMAYVLAQIASDHSLELAAEEQDALGRSLPEWPVFAEVPGEL